MNTKQRWIYIAFFWKYILAEQLGDMLELSIESISDYILAMWEEFYLSYNVVNFDKINRILSTLHTVK